MEIALSLSLSCKHRTSRGGHLLKDNLSQKRNTILERWLKLTLNVFQGAGQLKPEIDRFANPVGTAIREGISTIYDGLMQGETLENLSVPLDSIIRIGAVQDLAPSRATGFIFSLKEILRKELPDPELAGELLRFDVELDRLALMAFDQYTRCREKVHQISLNQVRAERERVLTLLARINPPEERVAAEP